MLRQRILRLVSKLSYVSQTRVYHFILFVKFFFVLIILLVVFVLIIAVVLLWLVMIVTWYGGMSRSSSCPCVLVFFPLHATLSELFHHFDEFLAVILEEIICNGQYSAYKISAHWAR